ncbi:MAG: FKBP-type peptidyl-prolyl cis-trans isomerase [Dysgonamonadaceae bacterium]|jgi:FKBP-type peptidyl-prolyl cis-trans isomerase FklB|nr:FKBP-type peptidyl-prolyl cis-trans isomerase [Dysgonamonadaceae bacterium]MDD3309405.1 FKBP-type peptidyl-prolyl cis-trans isomerase [Dysgonamonadaceae bacterium]MDD3900307.1 FKBP-type peptidyl-prolyl cis-trans isomerase [Dysgonamonadaceae bacterium]MDD4398382.1 FKBP-type peptidyl-prolyl cis-trans isomerase [Dysgonamonadaceae bacterium]MEA5082277.1 FKBP-type peptidyl-prolyl cis-trans isomerase [Dysgonamonadaceae bacterium]
MNKLSYALGMNMAVNLLNSGINDLDTESFVKGFTDTMSNTKTTLTPTEANQLIEDYFTKKQNEMQNKNIEEGKVFLAENKKRPEVCELESGLQYEILKEGNGNKPKYTDKVRCHYHGTLINGTVFDSSVQRGQPATFGVNQVIKGWVEALQLMSEGSMWRLFIPSELAYGKQGAGNMIGPNTTLIFDVELLAIV